MQALAQAIGPYLSGEKQAGGGHIPFGLKASGTPSATAPLYVNGGLFGRCDGTSDLINAMVGPIGYEGHLDWIGTDTEREFVDALTSITETGSEQSAACGDCISLSLQACAQFYCFGRFCRQSNELQFDRMSLRGNDGVPVRTLFGAITDSEGNVLVPNGALITDAFMLQSRSVGYLLRLKNATLLWSGNPCNNSGSYQEYPGFQLIVNTGKVDAYSQLSCDGIDSFLMDFQNNQPAATGTYSIVNWFRRMENQFKYRAEGAGMAWDTAAMDIVMHPNTWDCVARVYACAGIDLCAPTGNARITVSADQARERREEFLSRMALPINGRWYPVVLDSQIPDTPGQANGVCADIYFITREINGETITFGQYQDFNMTYGKIRNELVELFGSDDIAITDNGRFALVRDNSRGCFDIQAYTKPRLVARAPWLLGRIQNVCCDVLQEPFPDPSGSGGTYEKDGGRTTTSPPVLYGPCIDC
jgi:hypothetical protein